MADRDLLSQRQVEVGPSAETNALLDDIRRREPPSALKSGVEKMAAMVTSDKDMQQEIAHYTAAGLKTGALFFRGRVGLAASVGLFGLDEVNPNHSAGAMMLEGSVGALKGGATKYLFDKVGETQWNPAAKALGLGVGSRMTETMLRADTYKNDAGAFDPVSGLNNAFASAFDKRSLGTDLATFGLAYGMFRGADAWTGRALSNSRLGSAAFLGGSFGIVSGAHEELRNQIDSGQGLDYSKIALRGLAMGAVDAVASLPAGFQALSRLNPPNEFDAMRLSQIRSAAKANNLWMLEVPKPQFAADGTPVVMPTRGNMDQAFTAASRMATQVGHPLTLDWNSVRFRVDPGATREQMQRSYETAYNDPARLAEVKRQHELFERRSREEMTVAEREIDSLRGKPAREPEVMMRDLTNQARGMGSNWAAYAMSSLRHPSEIEAFARAYARFEPESALANLKDAPRFAQNGTQKIWEDVTKRIERRGAGEPNAGEARLFADIREFETLKTTARQHQLELRDLTAKKVVVMPNGPGTISSAGEAAGRFAAAINRPVTLDFNSKMVLVKPNASGAEVEAAYSKKK